MLAGVWTWVRLPPAPLLIGETLLNQRFFYFCPWYSLVFFCEKGSHKRSYKKEANLLKNQFTLQNVLRCLFVYCISHKMNL